MSVILEEIKNQADQNTLVKSSFMLDYIKSKKFLGFYSWINQFSITSIRFKNPALYSSGYIELIRAADTKEKFEDFLRILKLTFYKKWVLSEVAILRSKN